MKVGFIGLGIMGKPMCKNILRAGYELVVNNRTRSKADELVAEGAVWADTPADVARQCGVVITMLPNSPQVRQICLGPDGILEGAASGCTVVDMSSIDPVESRAIGAALAGGGVELLDAPVSGGEPKAIDGTLSVMVGGSRERFEQVEPVLKAMAETVTYVGGLGSGNVAKLANQVIVALNIAAVSEALTLAKMAGVDPQLVFEAIRGGLAGSTVMEAKVPMMLSGDDRPGFKVDLHIKDLDNVLNCAHSIGAPVPMTAQVQEILQWLRRREGGQKDHSAIAQYYEYLAGVKIGG